MEVIFVEEDSKDNTLLSISKYAPEMKIKYKIFHLAHKGLGFSRNIVYENAQGSYIVWLDDGTMIPKDYVRKNVEIMENNPCIGIATGIISVYSGLHLTASLENMSGLVFSNENCGGFTKELPGTGGAIFRVNAIMRVGGFDGRITGATEDTDIAYRISTAGWKIFVTQIEYSRDYCNSLGKVWAKSLWYGYGLHFMLHKHRELRNWLCRSTPLAGFLQGILSFSKAYKLTHKKIAFLLPIFFLIQRTALCWGFIKAHINSYGHF